MWCCIIVLDFRTSEELKEFKYKQCKMLWFLKAGIILNRKRTATYICSLYIEVMNTLFEWYVTGFEIKNLKRN
jgi:hypothetical protein